MFRKARRKVASSISIIQEGDNFLYNSALRPPINKSVPIGNITYKELLDTSKLEFAFNKPFLSKPFFKMGNSSLDPEDLSYMFEKKVKTNAVFFQLLYVPSKIALHKDIDPKPPGPSANNVEFHIKKAGNFKIEVIFEEPDINDYLQNLKAKVKNIELLKIDEFLGDGDETKIKEVNLVQFKNDITDINVRSFGKLKVKKIKSDAVNKIPKVNRVDVPGIGKYKASVSTIKLQKLIVNAISKSPLLNFIAPSVAPQSLSFLSTKTINYDLDAVKKEVLEPKPEETKSEETIDVNKELEQEVKTSQIKDESKELEQGIKIIEQKKLSKELEENLKTTGTTDLREELDEEQETKETTEVSKELEEGLKNVERKKLRKELEQEIKSSKRKETSKEQKQDLSPVEINVESKESKDDIKFSEVVNITEEFKKISKPAKKVSWEERQDRETDLNIIEDKNARYLAENKRAFLAEELGLQKIKESYAAIKFLFQNGDINSTLIVYPEGSLGYSENEKQLGVVTGWIGNLEKYCQDMSYSVIKGNDDERINTWNKPSLIHLVDHNTFFNDYNSKTLDKQRLSSFDCVIIDEVQELIQICGKNNEVFKEIDPNIFWVLTSIVGDDIISSINEVLNDKIRIEEKKIRFLTDSAEDDAVINHEEYWLEPNELQRLEYKDNFDKCRKDLKKVLETGNPFRYQSNIFTLVHKLYQIENFSQKSISSPKADLLIKHIQTIEKNMKKVIVLSQYDKDGTKKIEQLLDENKINYINVPTSFSVEEMDKAIALFKSKKSVTVFLTNAQLSRLNFRDFIVPYVIRFDSWWNPAVLWQTKNLFDLSKRSAEKNVVNIFTYKMLNTIDEFIKRILLSRNYMDDNIVSAMSPTAINDLIVVDDWFRIFDMPIEDEKEYLQKLYEETVENLNNLALKEYRDTLIRFLFTIGYANTKIMEDESSESFDITGKGKSANHVVNLTCKVLAEDIITREKLKQIISDVTLSQKNNIFVITRGKFEKGCSEIAKNKVTLLDVEKLAAYLVNLQIVQPNIDQQKEQEED